MPLLKCPQCARELPAGAQTCPWDGTQINSILVRSSLWSDDQTATKTAIPPSPGLADVPNEGSNDAGARPALLPGQKLGDYQVISPLGAGGMGEVYAGEQPMIGKKVAIKVLKSEIAADSRNVQRMLSEARAVNAIRHRGIVDIFNFGTLPDGRPYLVMEYLEGIALDAMLRKQGALIAADATEFLEEICSALAAAHGAGIVHRDLKPGNVFIVSSGNTRTRYVKLLDFGLAKGEASGEASRQTRAGTVVGTPDYIAPEQARGGTITPRTDLYSLGVMAFEMLTGGLPFVAESLVELMMMHVQTPAPHVSSKIDLCPPALDALIYQLMAKNPADRPRSAEGVRLEFARIRRELREGETVIGAARPVSKETIRIPPPEADTPRGSPFPESNNPPAAPPPPRPSKPRPVFAPATARANAVQPRQSRRKAWAAVLALPLLLAAGTGWLYLNSSPPPPVPVPVQVDLPVVEPMAEPSPVVDPREAEPAPPVKPRNVTPPPRSEPRPEPNQGPTRADLERQLNVMESRLRSKMPDSLLKEVDAKFKEKIRTADSLEKRKTLAAEMKAARFLQTEDPARKHPGATQDGGR